MYRLGENAKAERAFSSFGGQTAFLSGCPAPERVLDVGHGHWFWLKPVLVPSRGRSSTTESQCW